MYELLIVGIGSPPAALRSVWVILEDRATDGTPCTAGRPEVALCTEGAVGVVVARKRSVGTTGRPLPAGPVACVVLALVAGVAVGVDSATRPVGPLGPKIREYALWCSSSWLRVLAARGRVVVVVGAVVTTTRRTTTTIVNSKQSHRRSRSGFVVPGTVVSDALERRWHSSSSSRHHHEDVFVRYCCCCSC